MITCQKNVFSGIPSHGKQKPLRLIKRYGTPGDRVHLACGCDFPVSWVPTTECKCLEGLPKPTSYVGQQGTI